MLDGLSYPIVVCAIYRVKIKLWARGKIFDFINRHQRHNEGWCMCGDKMENHGYESGHAPVDMWYYYRDQFVLKEK